MKVKKIKRMTCTVMAATLSISPFLPLTEAYANNQIEIEAVQEGELVSSSEAISKVDEALVEEVENMEVEILMNEADSNLHLKEMDTPQQLNQEESDDVFILSDWAYEENERFIILTAARNDKMSIYIPGEYNGKQVILQDLKIFPTMMKDLKLEEVNEKKVGLIASDISKSFYSKKIESLDLRGLDTSKVTNMSELFRSTSELSHLNLTGWDTSNVTNMSQMFNGAKKLKSIDLTSFNTSKVTTMKGMFSGMVELDELNLSSFNTSNVTDMSDMFSRSKLLRDIDLTSFDTFAVTTMDGMFEGLESMSSLDLRHFNTSNVTNMSSMFSGMKALKTLNIRSFNTLNVEKMSAMFQNTESLEVLELKNFNTSKVKDMSSMFAGMSKLEILDTTSFDTTKVTNMSKMFYKNNLSNLDLSHFNTISVKNMSSMFAGMEKIISLDLTYFDTSNVQNMSSMFADMPKVRELDLSNFNLQNINNMSSFLKIKEGEGQSVVIFTADSEIQQYDFEELDFRKVSIMSYSMPTTSSNVISGTAPSGTEIKLVSGGNVLGQARVGSDKSYEFNISKYAAGEVLTLEITTPRYQILNKKLVVRNEFKNFTLKTVPLPTTTTIYGTGDPGAKVEVYLSDGTHLDITTVNSNGNFKLVIPKQKVHTVLTFKQSKYNYKPIVYKVAVYDELTVFETPTITMKSTALYGKGVPGAKVGIYTENGTRLAITTVNSKGNYKLVIPTQKVGTVLTIKQAKTGYGTLSKNITVLGEFNTFKINSTSASSTAIYGKGEPGAKVAAYVNGRQIGSTTTVNSKGNYKIVIPKQRVGTKVQVKMAKNGYVTTAKNTTILNDLKTFTYSTPSASTTKITGKGVAGAKVGVYTSSGKRLAITTVSSKGTYTLTIPKQKAGTVLTIKQAKSGYLTLSKEVKVLNALKTFTHSTVKASSKTITGKGVSGAKVGIYTSSGKQIAIATVNSKGNYKLTIPKQKAGTKLVLKQAKSGYLTLSKNITVVK